MIISIAQAQVFLLAFTRIMIILAQIPIFGAMTVPSTYKIGFGILVTLIALPWQPLLPPETPAIPVLTYALAVIQEIIIGLLAGFAATLTFGAFQIAGRLMDAVSGFGAAQVFNPALGEMQSPLDTIFLEVVFLFFLIINGHHTFLLGLQRTFTYLPVMSPIPALSADRLFTMTSELIRVGFQMALPVMAALIMTDLALGLIARVAPQVQVFFLGLPLKVFIGMVGLMVTISILMPVMGDLFRKLGGRMIQILGM